MNKKGFTLVEILAVIVIMGIIGLVGISAISNNIDESRRSAFATLAKNFAESARSMRGNDKLPHDPKDGEALLLRVDALNGVDEIDDYSTPYGELSLNYCYVILVNSKNNIKYYVTLLDNTKHAIYLTEYSLIDKKSVIPSSNPNVSKIINYSELSTGKKINIEGTDYSVTSHRDTYVVLKK